MHRKKILLVLGLAISLSLATPSAVFAKDIPKEQGVSKTGENIETNNGTVEHNSENVTIETNNGVVNSNAGTIETNTDTGIVGENDGKVETNNGMVESNTGGTIDTNAGTVGKNGGDIKVNTGTVKENNGVVEENQGTVNNAPSGQILVNNGGTVTGEGKVEINLGNKGKVDETVTVVQQMWQLNYQGKKHLKFTDGKEKGVDNIYTRTDADGKLQVWVWEDGSVIVKPLGNWDTVKMTVDNGANIEKLKDGTFKITNVTADINLGVTLINHTVSDDSYSDNDGKQDNGILEGLIGGSYTAVSVNGTPLDLKIAFGNTNYDWYGYIASADKGVGNIKTLYTGVIEGASKDCLVTFGNEVNFVTLQNAYVVFRDTKTGEVTYVDLGEKRKGDKLSFHIPYENCEFGIVTGTRYDNQTHHTVMGAEAGMAALSAGNDFIGAATEGLGLATNTGADGVSSFAQMGGGRTRQETG